MKITIVLPTYNERENIRELIPRIFQTFKQNSFKGQVIVVDDNSPDRTVDIVKELQAEYPLELIIRERKKGLGSAYIEGFKKALKNSDLIFEMDADLSHDPVCIPKFIKKVQDGFDVVIGSRLIEGGKIIGWDWTRRLISRGGNMIGKYIAGVWVSDLTSGYRVYKKEVLGSINLEDIKSQGYDFQLEMIAKSLNNGFKVGTVPIIFKERVGGKSKLSKWEGIRFLVTALKIRSKLI